MIQFSKNIQYYKFCSYGFLKNLRFFDAFFILFLVEKGLPYTQIGILYAVREIFINILEIPSGLLADSYGRKTALISSFVAYIASFYAFYISMRFSGFMVAFILYGFGDAFRSGTHKGMIMDYLKIHNWHEQKIDYYGHTRSWSQKGSAASALIAGLIVFSSGSFENIFLFSIIPYLINLLLILSYPVELNISKSQKKLGKNNIVFIIKSFLQVIKQIQVLRIINTSAVHSAYLKAIKDYIQPLMVHVAVLLPFMLNTQPQKKNAVVIAVIYFLIYLATSYASRISAKIYNRNKLNISYVTLILGFTLGIISGIFYVYELWYISLLAFVGIYIVENIRKPILTGVIADQVPNEILASVISAQSLLKTLITAVLAVVFGFLADQFDIGIAFVVVSIFLILSTVILKSHNRK